MTNKFRWFVENDIMSTKGLWAIEWLSIIYGAITAIFALFLWQDLAHPGMMLLQRGFILLGTLALWRLYRLWSTRIMTFIRITAQMALLSFWYPETYEFNSRLQNLDHFFTRWDEVLFGCQPSLEFSRMCPWGWLSEALNMGYFSYYIMIVAVMVFFFLCHKKEYERASFVVMCSFFIYYLIYVCLPVVGPQFYFQAVGVETIEAGIYPEVGTYFSQHTEMLPAPGDADGFFYRMVRSAQDTGERPTAAFPSSHIGISLILLYLVFPYSKKIFVALLPFVILLSLATVYIQAHYLVDAIAGVISSVLVFLLSSYLFDKGLFKQSLNAV